MHERTQRAVARMLFVFCCAVPTIGVITLVSVRNTPWYNDYLRRCWEYDLSHRLGVTVQIGSLEHPAPKTVRLGRLRLLEPETGAEVGKVRLATWVRGEEKNGIRLSQPELNSEHLAYAWRLVHERFLCRPELTTQAVRLVADDLTVHSSTGSMTMRDVDAWIRPLDRRIEAMIQCVPASRRDGAPIHITAVRDRSPAAGSGGTSSPAPMGLLSGTAPPGRSGGYAFTDWKLHTGDIPLPCSVLADHLSLMRNLGPDAAFTGTLRWRVDAGGWSIDLGGSRFDNIELGDLMHSVPHRLTGKASVRFERCLIEPGSAVDVSGTFAASGGFIGRSLLRSAETQLGFDVAEAEHPDRDTAYDRIAVRFDLFGPQLTLAGICHQQRGLEYLPPGSVVAAGGRRLAGSGGAPQSWASLVRAFWHDGRETLPVSADSAWLLQLLPAPSATPPGIGSGPRITNASELRGRPDIAQP